MRPDDYFGLTPDRSEALVALVARRENIAGYFAGHTHGNRVYRFPSARNVPFVEVACTKDYPGAWAEYRVYEGGYTQEVHRVTGAGRVRLGRATREMFLGLYGELARGELDGALLHRSGSEHGANVGALAGIRVVDMATLIAAPGAARLPRRLRRRRDQGRGAGAATAHARLGWRDPRDDTALYLEAGRAQQARRWCST